MSKQDAVNKPNEEYFEHLSQGRFMIQYSPANRRDRFAMGACQWQGGCVRNHNDATETTTTGVQRVVNRTGRRATHDESG